MLSILVLTTAFAATVLGNPYNQPPTPIVTPAPELVARQCAGIATHVVAQGETLSRIAANLGVGVCNIAASNHIGNINTIYASQTLTVRASGCEPVNNGPGCTLLAKPAAVHIAVAGDTFWKLAVSQGIPLPSIVGANPAIASDAIPIGAAIVIPIAL
ncbi:hypothetical protein GGP41_001898 [Bipolaris sorokiniana]|uniref:LysM domain-containing protein n=2 Tax=Cochliobolus sativus TaxID=45130 RepID=A0A8H5ZT23_COCSA|nr:uncharacterized protein COCSADRAFT_28081 [Bipolaris sorokiniana ND90Pr]EMD62605.1 hypothetical protein COCSADRAFT_28081 [Bipolaris sorokiniana ND90Pr]KAF5853333.1 hypothetical protein GGP41_001898 [Bipolaris sorokiniana]